MKIIIKWQVGLLLGILGSTCLGASLPQIIAVEEPASLFNRAGVAFQAGLTIFVVTGLIAGAIALIPVRCVRSKIAWPVMRIITVVFGVALSSAISFAIAGVIATFPLGLKFFLTLMSVAVLYLGYWVTREFWRELRSWLAAFLRKSPAGTVGPNPPAI